MEILYFVIISEIFLFRLIHELYSPCQLNVAKTGTSFEKGAKYFIVLIKRKVANVGRLIIALELELVDFVEFFVKNFDCV
jgi:hypothetical protein